jgi:DNA-binding LacI/PurR family transcriptional regulator
MIKGGREAGGASRRLSEQLEADIRRRRLRAGDGYLTASEAAELLGVSRATAHRAFQVLSRRGILSSKRRAGTVVGERFDGGEFGPGKEERIRILVVQQRIREGRFFDDLLKALQDVLPGREVLISYLPEEGALEMVRGILRESGEARVGYLLLGCPRLVLEEISKAEIPAVVLGRTYSTAKDIPSVSANNHQRGYLLARHLLERGHRRIGLLMPETWLPGDTEMFEGVNKALSDFQIAHGALFLRNTPQHADAVEAEIRTMTSSPHPPTGLICKERAVELVEDVLKRIGDERGKAVSMEVLVEVTDVRPEIGKRHTHVTSEVGLLERTRRAAEMLKTQFAGDLLETQHEEYPVRLVPVDQVV